jgi:hypothetical protein
MGKLLGDEKPDSSAIDVMQNSPYNFDDTKWAAYQNHDMGHRDLGHLKFLACGPQNTMKAVNSDRMPDFPGAINWRYQFVGYVNLETGKIEADKK